MPGTFVDYSDKVLLDRYWVTVIILGQLPVLVRKQLAKSAG